jgi:hypothetical protein
MAATNPPIYYAGLYRKQSIAAMHQAKAQILPEHTTQAPQDPLNAAVDVEGGDHHGLAIALDAGLAESSWLTAKRRGAFVALGALIGFKPARDIPAAVEVLADLTSTPTPTVDFMEAGALFGVSGDPRVRFEATENIGPPGALAWHWTKIYDVGTDVFADWTGPTLWGNPWTVGDTMYFGHAELMPNMVRLDVLVTGQSAKYAVVFEYADRHSYQAAPGSVAVNGAGTGLVFDVEDYLEAGFAAGLPPSDYRGVILRVVYRPTGASETATVDTLNDLSVGFLGQTSPSLNASDYHVSGEWLPIPLTNAAEVTDDHLTITIELPDDAEDTIGANRGRRWAKSTVDNETGFWLRMRLMEVTLPLTELEVTAFEVPDEATWTARALALQGRTLLDVDLGSSDAGSLQEFSTGRADITEGGIGVVYVDGDPWGIIDTLYTAGPTDENAEEFEQPVSGAVGIRFGDGANGAVPGAGLAITADMRIGAEFDGNVGAGSVDVALGGIYGVENVRNPKPAIGWRRKEGANPDNAVELASMRRRGPGDYRARGRILTPDDAVFLLTDPRAAHGFIASDGSRPIYRAAVVLEGSGPKTAKIVAVGSNGELLTTEQLSDADVYLNGSRRFLTTTGGIMAQNQQAELVNYTRNNKSFAITIDMVSSLIATPEAEARVKAAVMALLDVYVHPLAPPLVTGGSDLWLWAVGQDVSANLIRGIIAAHIGGIVELALAIAPDALISAYGLPYHDRTATTIALVPVG